MWLSISRWLSCFQIAQNCFSSRRSELYRSGCAIFCQAYKESQGISSIALNHQQDYGLFHIAHKYIQRSTTKSGIDFHEFSSGPVIAQPLAWFPFFNLPSTSTSFPDLSSVLFRDRSVPSCRPLRRNAFISSPLHARSSADLVDRTVQLLRGISDHFLMKYSRSTTKSSFVSQHHIFVFLLLSSSLSRESLTLLNIVSLVAHFFLRSDDLLVYRYISFLAMHLRVSTFHTR